MLSWSFLQGDSSWIQDFLHISKFPHLKFKILQKLNFEHNLEAVNSIIHN